MIASSGSGVSAHLAEFLPPFAVLFLYLGFYAARSRALARQGRPINAWRAVAFVSGVLLMATVQVGPADSLADQLLVYHMVQHLLIGEVASFLVVIGLTGPLLQPLLSMRISRLIRPLTHPVVALTLWAANLYLWHLPFFYELAIRHDLIHALEHACFFWFGMIFWVALLGPLPKPAWFGNWGRVGYVIAARLAGSALANVLVWIPTVFYPYYRANDLRVGLTPLEDQKLAGGVMMLEQMLIGVAVLTWLFIRATRQDEMRQQLLDLAEDFGVELSERRASIAAADGDGATRRLAERLVDAGARGGPGGQQL